jgi:RNA polymerase sigma factor (TIGR02999 family)
VSEILHALDPVDHVQAGELFALVYDDLRALAARQLQRERDANTLQPTALVHEAYLRLVHGPRIAWRDRAHFFRIAARAMRQVLVDAARRRTAVRHGGKAQRVSLDPELVGDAADQDVIALHEALERLGRLDGELERLIELRFFTGFTLDEAAEVLGVSRRKAANDWAAARLWLRRELVAS